MSQSPAPGARIIFMGTPEFAVASLDAFVKNGYNIVGVITAPDKPAGRGMKMNESAVKKYAVEKGLHILQPTKLKDSLFIEKLRELKADLQVVVAFRMLPEMVWNMPRLGTVNVHASLLPKYRGAAPINWAIINGEKSSGVTTFKLTHEIDTGNILLQKKINIDSKETAGDLHDKLKVAGAELLVETVEGVRTGKIQEQPQEVSEEISKATHAPKIFTETCRIDWSRSVEETYNLIRGLSPFPGAFTELTGRIFKIYSAEKYNTLNVSLPGELETDNKTYLRFACADGYIYAKEIQAEGKRKMLIEEFLRGFREKA